MQQARHPISDIITQRDVEMDAFLPVWARRSNPIVRRELGPFWKRLFPDLSLIARIVGVQLVLILLLPVEFLLTITLPVAMLAVVLLPVVAFLYGRVLVSVVNTSASSMSGAYTNNTLVLLRLTPLPLSHIVLGKVAAGVWQRVEDIDLILTGLTIFSLPFLTIYYLGDIPSSEITLLARLPVALAVMALPLRIMLEPFMFGALALAMGAAFPTRAVAVVATLSALVFYYLVLFVPLAATMAWWARLLFELVLPLALPVAISVGAVVFALHKIQND